MQALVIKQSQGLWTAETSDGVRWSAATLPTLIAKMVPVEVSIEHLAGASASLFLVFEAITDKGSGQVAHGVAGA